MSLFNKKKIETNETESKSIQELSKEKKQALEAKEAMIKAKEPTKTEPVYSKYKDVKWERVSKEKVFEVMADIMNENKRLVQENNRLQSEVEHSYNSKTSSGPSAKKILEEIAQRIAPDLIKEINTGKSFSEIEMQEYIIHYVLDEKQRHLNKILAQVEKEKMQKELLSELQQQVCDILEKKNQEEAEKEELKPFTEKDFDKIVENNESDDRKSNIILKAIPLEKARIVFNDKASLAVVKAVGLKGLSEFPEISKFVKETEGVSENRLETVVNNLEKEDIVEVVRINTFQRNTGLRLIKLRDEIGYKLFRETFKKDPVKSEMQIIRAENDNYEHGYNIKETCEVLRKNYGYEDVSMDRKNNTITVSNLNTWIPDIIAINPISKKKEYFEVEMGTHNAANFNFKLDKALLITNELKIITPNKMKADELMGKVRTWYNSKKNHPNIIIKVYTYVEFKRKEESRMYPTVLEEKNILDEVKELERDKKIVPGNNQNNNQKNFNKNENLKNNKSQNTPAKEPKKDVEDNV